MFKRTAFVLLAAAAFAVDASADWRDHINWAKGNRDAGGSVDCPLLYIGAYGHCALLGGRACLMGYATGAALAHQDQAALNLALITQCHNGGAAGELISAGAEAVGAYLRGDVVSLPGQGKPGPPAPAPAPNSSYAYFNVNGGYYYGDTGFNLYPADWNTGRVIGPRAGRIVQQNGGWIAVDDFGRWAYAQRVR